MKRKARFLGLITILALAATAILTTVPGWAQKTKPPTPPPTAPDPAIAFSAWYGSPDHKDLMVVNADGTNKVALVSAKAVHNTRPDWSPDGRQIVFTENALRDTYINIINADGTGQQRILKFNSSWGPVSWSPVPLGDGQHKILYADCAFLDGVLRSDNDLFLVNLDGSGVQQLTNTIGVNESVFEGHYIAWSPDAQFIADATCDEVLIYRIGWNGTKFTASCLGDVISISTLQGSDCIVDVDWANTQNKLVVSAHPPWTSSFDLFIIDIGNFLLNPDPANPYRTPIVTEVTNTPQNNERECSWSPDDSQISYIQGNSIWVINANGNGAKEIVKPERRVLLELPHWRRNIMPQ